VSDLQRWLAALPRADPDAARAVGEDLLARWAEPQRHYHTLAHLDCVLSIVDANARLADDPESVRLAAWFHDAVYDPMAGSGRNEAASAALAERALSLLGLPTERICEVARLVHLTAGHDVAAGDHNGGLLADADLAVLAAEPEVYDAYAAAIRREYAHLPDALYRLGRRAVLQQLLDLPALYRVVPARTEWSELAHANLRREVRALSS